MRISPSSIRCGVALLPAMALALTLVASAIAQSQEAKPSATATTARENAGQNELPQTGIMGDSWSGPRWGVRLQWDPGAWTVENELIEHSYEGLQIGTPDSTAFIEAYEGFAGSAEDCLADAEREIGERGNVSEAVRLSGRPLPETGPERGPAQLFGVVATLPDGEIYRGVEYVECRTIVPGSAVLELTWQTAASDFNDELPLASDLFSSVSVPAGAGAGSSEAQSTPRATPVGGEA